MAPISGENIRLIGQLSTLGLSFVFALVIGFGGGYLLDGWLGWSAVADVPRLLPWSGCRNPQRLSRDAVGRTEPQAGTVVFASEFIAPVQLAVVTSRPDHLGRFVRTFATSVAVLAVAAFAMRPGEPRLALGVVGGGVLAAAGGLGDPRCGGAGRLARAETGRKPAKLAAFRASEVFHKACYIRPAAYGMMAPLATRPGWDRCGSVGRHGGWPRAVERCAHGPTDRVNDADLSHVTIVQFSRRFCEHSTVRGVPDVEFMFLAVASPVFAQGAGADAANSGLVQWSIITAGFALAIAAAGGAIGQGRAMARRPRRLPAIPERLATSVAC